MGAKHDAIWESIGWDCGDVGEDIFLYSQKVMFQKPYC